MRLRHCQDHLFKTFPPFIPLPSDLSSKPCLYLRVARKAQQSGKNVLSFLFCVSSLCRTHDVCFSEVRQFLCSLCLQLISPQDGCYDGHGRRSDHWLHLWLLEHYSVRVVMNAKEMALADPCSIEVVQALVVPLQPCRNTCLVVLQHSASSWLLVQ